MNNASNTLPMAITNIEPRIWKDRQGTPHEAGQEMNFGVKAAVN
jgi:hypothetical protein